MVWCVRGMWEGCIVQQPLFRDYRVTIKRTHNILVFSDDSLRCCSHKGTPGWIVCILKMSIKINEPLRMILMQGHSLKRAKKKSLS